MVQGQSDEEGERERKEKKARDVVNPMLDNTLLTISSACIFFLFFFCYR
jgi:hypothetical protein